MWCCLLLHLYVYSIRSHTPDVTSDNIPPELPAHRKYSPPTVPRRGSPGVSRRQLVVDNSTPPTLPPKKNQQVEYAEVPVSFVNIVQLVTLTCCCCYYSKTEQQHLHHPME